MMDDDEEKSWLLPSEIPFDQLKGHALEECLFWLLDGIGARDITWRVGGTGAGAADGGRDLEASFFVPDDDGQIITRRWWVECKGRSGTLETEAVRSACNNALAEDKLDTLVIATNTTFTNPTRDWVDKWQIRFPKPKILLWDRASLERMLAQQPATVLRLFEGGLSSSGYLRALRDRFWNLLEYSSIERIKRIWLEREQLEIGVMERFALIANEFAHGDIEERPWAGTANAREVLETFQYGMFNLVYLYTRIVGSGSDQGPAVKALAYLLLSTVREYHPDAVTAIFARSMRTDSDEPMPDELLAYFVMPVLDTLWGDLQLVCSSDCDRFFPEDSLKHWEKRSLPASYWARFGSRGLPPSEDGKAYRRLERTTEPCRVGFELEGEASCPLYAIEVNMETLSQALTTIAHVVRTRAPKRRRA